jgi:hypothetical protein
MLNCTTANNEEITTTVPINHCSATSSNDTPKKANEENLLKGNACTS